MIRKILIPAICGFAVFFFGCVSMPTKDCTAFRDGDPRSILVIPVVNRSVDVNAPDYFLSTISRPVAERGYYVFPVHLVKRIMEDDGLSDADMVHAADPTRLAEIFGADAILYIIIERWDAQYVIFSTTITVEFTYVLKDGATGEKIWQNHQTMVYESPQGSSDSDLANTIFNIIAAAVTKTGPDYVPLAQEANAMAVGTMSAGPYNEAYCVDTDESETAQTDELEIVQTDESDITQ